MGIGDWLKDRGDDVSGAVSDVVDHGLDAVDTVGDFAEDTIDSGLAYVGEGINWTADRAADGLDMVGAHGMADDVDTFGDDVADALGGDVAEKELGDTDDPKQIIHGDAAKITETTTSLVNLASGFESAAGGLKGISTSEWTGDAADAFHAIYDKHPGQWSAAADACTDASNALDGYASTLTWAQGQAKSAIDLYQQGEQESKQAVDAYNTSVDDYNSAADRYNQKSEAGEDPGTKPTKPGAFHDPGQAKIEQARSMVTTARSQRDEAGETAATLVQAAMEKAPPEPTFHDRMAGNASDYMNLSMYNNVHSLMGVVKGTTDLVRFARTLNMTDPYNLTHPAEYLNGLNNTVVGLVHGVNNPVELVQGMLGSGWGSDPAEAMGKLVPQVVLAVATDGAGTAATGGERAALGLADDVASNGGRTAAELADNPSLLDDLARSGESKALVGEPVDAATGEVLLEQVDVALPGILPLTLRRRYGSHWRYGGWFGPRWASSFDERLDLTDDGEVVLVTADGIVAAFPAPTVDDPSHAIRGPGWTLTRTEVGGYRVDDPSTGRVRHFLSQRRLAGGSPTVPLVAETDPTGHRIMYVHDEHDRPVEVRHSGGYRVLVETEGHHISSLTVVHDDGSEPVTLADYRYAGGNLTEVVTTSGEALSFRYDEHDRLVEWLDRNGTSFTHAYDELDRCVSQDGTDHALAATYEYSDEPDGSHISVMIDALGGRHTYVSNRRWQLVASTDPLGRTTRMEWDDSHRLERVVDPLGHVTRRSYDTDGMVNRIELPDGTAREMEHVRAGGRSHPSVVRDPDGAEWRLAYDERGLRTAVTAPDGTVTHYRYTEAGHLAEVVDPAGRSTRYETDGAGLPVLVMDADGNETRLTRDGFGRVVETIDAMGERTRIEWDADGRPARRITADGRVEQLRHDAEGNVLEVIDAAGHRTQYDYTTFDRVARQTSPDGGVTSFDWDRLMRLTRVTNAAGLTWTYEYDLAGQLVAETDFDDRTTRYSYDDGGRLASRISALGQTATFSHDALGRVSSRTVDGVTTRFTRDAAGRPLRIGSPASEVVWQYDLMGRMTSERIDDRTALFTHDVLGRRVGRTSPGGVETSWAHGPRGVAAVDVAGHTLRFDRDALGRETRRHLGGSQLDQVWAPGGRLASQTISTDDGVAVTGADIAARMSGLAAEPGASAPLQHRAYAYDAAGIVVGIDDQLSGNQRMELDPTGRVLSVAGATTESFTYDPMGNITSTGSERRTVTGTRLVATDRARYSYDALGRLTTKVVRKLDRKDDVWQYAWNGDDRLVAVTTPDGTRWRYRYDPLGRRTAKERLASEGDQVVASTRYDWDGSQLLAETTDDIVTTWVHDGLTPIGQLEQNDVDEEFFAIVTDLVGMPTELIDEAGEIVWHARRSLWGASTGQTVDDRTPLRFPGQYADDESGLHYNLNRYYDPATGRYLSQDPLGLSPAPNPTTYVANPQAAIDPLGLGPCSVTDISGLPDDIVKLSEQNISNSGTTVLGRWSDPDGVYPGYIDKAQGMGASYYDIGDDFSRLTGAQQSGANMHFLDTRIAAEDRMIFSMPKQVIERQAADAIAAGGQPSWLMKEIDYLSDHGYVWKNQWSMGPK